MRIIQPCLTLNLRREYASSCLRGNSPSDLLSSRLILCFHLLLWFLFFSVKDHTLPRAIFPRSYPSHVALLLVARVSCSFIFTTCSPSSLPLPLSSPSLVASSLLFLSRKPQQPGATPRVPCYVIK